METSFPLHLVPLLPLLGAAVLLLFGKRLGPGVTSLVGCGAVATAALVATRAVIVLAGSDGVLMDRLFQADWISAGADGGPALHVAAGLMLDRLSAVMVLVVTWIGLLIHIYSTGYMKGDPGYARFFGYLNLFTGSMLILVLGDSLPVTFVGWEGVGLCSYLLIGFWYTDDKNASAGRKAFIVNRIGDYGFFLGMCLLFALIGTLKYGEIGQASHMATLQKPFWLGWPGAYFVGILIFLGCTGKSAQIPLYVWLPAAMAGPTPVSALIHAATMVTAGVYVVARTHVIFDVFPSSALMTVAIIGALTALYAATIGIVQRDFKRVLAYSTVSQLGFMFVGVGTGAYVAGIFHLMTHAFFKAGLFLGAGSVMHALGGEGDITRMGGLRKYMPITHWTFFIYCLAIAGIFPFAGFFSKDAILAGAYAAHFTLPHGVALQIGSFPIASAEALEHFVSTGLPKLLWAILAVAAMCTAFYMWRLYFLVFTGKFRGTREQERHIHESPPEMTFPLLVLALGSVCAGWLGVPGVIWHDLDLFGRWLEPPTLPMAHELGHAREWMLMGVALGVSVAGIALSYLYYFGGFSKLAEATARALRPLYRLVYHKYYIDEIYDLLFVRPLKALAELLRRLVDVFLIDTLLVNSWGFVVSVFGKAVRYLQNGDVQRYLVAILLGSAAMLFFSTNWKPMSAADFSVKTEGRRVTVDFSPGHRPPPRNLSYRIRWGDTDRAWDQESGFQSLTHEYQNSGSYRIIVEAEDQVWRTSSRSGPKLVRVE